MPYFYLPAYSSFCKKEGAEILFFSDENENSIACKRWKNKLLTFLQPLYAPLHPNGKRLSVSSEKKFLNNFIASAKKNKSADRIGQSPAFAIFSAYPEGSTHAPFGTYFIDLENNDIDTLSKNLHGKHRNVIRNAEKNGVEIKYGKNCLTDFYTLYRDTMKRSSMYCEPFEFFEDLQKALPENSVCGVCYHNGTPQGGLFMPYSKFAAFYLYGASTEKMEVTGAMNYLHWNTMKLLKEKEVKRYDFVGARLSKDLSEKLKGIQQFKERFGATLEKGHLWKKDINAAKCKTYDGLLSLKLKLKGHKMPKDLISQESEKFDEGN